MAIAVDSGAEALVAPIRAHGFPWWLVPFAVLAVYWPCLGAGLVYDDWINFDRHQALRERDWWALLTQPYYGPDTTYWRPLTSLVMAFAYQLGPAGVHALAMLCHACAAVVVGSIGRQLGGDARLATFAALLFAVSPLQVESVAWASALPAVPAGLFVLLTLRSVLSWTNGNNRRWPWPAAIWLGLAFACKESSVLAVPLLAVATFATAGRRPRRAKWGVVGAATLLATVWLVWHVAMVGYRPVLGHGLVWLGGAAQMVVRQVGLLVWPWPLTPFRAPPHEVGSAWLDAAAIAAVLIAVVGAVVVNRRLSGRLRVAGALAAAPIVFAALTYDAVGPHPLADRYLYLAVAGCALLVAAALRRQLPELVLLVVAGGAAAFAQCSVWRDDRSFVAHVLAVTPADASVRVLAGGLALRDGDAEGLQQARRHFHAALDLWRLRTDPFARRQRAAAIAGLAWCDFHDPASGAAQLGSALVARFREALAQDDDFVPAWVGCGVACGLNRRYDEALAAFAFALAIDPCCPEAWFNLGRTQLLIGRRAEAADSLRRALRCDPQMVAVHHLLASLR